MITSTTLLLLILSYFPGQPQNYWEIITTDITEHLHDIEFVNDSVGFIYSYGTGNIYKTIDEGYIWKKIKQTDSIYFEQIQFINSKRGWICGENGKVLGTNDCGSSWTDLSIDVEYGNLLLYGMCFINDSTGYVSGALLNENKLKPIIFITYNGGISWTEIFEDIPHMVLNLEKNGDDFYATGNGFIIKIEDLSNSWRYVFRDTSRIIGQIRDIQFADDNQGIAVSFNGQILITANGGESFTHKSITKNRLRSITFIGANNWIAAGDNNKNDGAVLYSTDDNGESWEKNNEFPDIHRITSTNKTIWIVGKNGLIAKMKK